MLEYYADIKNPVMKEMLTTKATVPHTLSDKNRLQNGMCIE